MDDILEFVFELVMEIALGIAEDTSKPKWLRYLAGGLMGIGVAAILGFFVWVGIHVWTASQTGGIIYFAVLLLIALLLTVFLLRKRRKARKNKELEPLELEWQ